MGGIDCRPRPGRIDCPLVMKPRPKPAARPRRAPSAIVPNAIVALGILVAAIILIMQARRMWFTQDDAFISYRYARNALDGHGLVFNLGERVEGYTNFLWVIWLILWGRLGIEFDVAAKTLGLASALGMIALAALMARRLWLTMVGKGAEWAAVAAALLVGVNGSLAYWSISGLETAFFGFLVTWSVWLWLHQSRVTPLALALATMTRPEGGLVWLVMCGCEYITSRDVKAMLTLFVTTALLLAPFGLFKLLYYGSLFPNPFYAKTGVGWEYVQSGLEYAWLFLQHYALWGLALVAVVPAVFLIPGRLHLIPRLWLIFAGYIVAIGGEVLRPHRFFVPILPLLAVSVLGGLAWLVKRQRSTMLAVAGAGGVVFALAISSLLQPREILNSTRDLERGLVWKMGTVASNLRANDSTNFSIAASTIGKISYDLPGHRVIDMLGLTDSTVARHPEQVPGNVTTWRERNYNATYVLSQNPDYILFSTGHKPSAPAERALVLHSKFRNGYYTVIIPTPQRMLAIHHRKAAYAGGDTVWPSIDLATQVNAVFNAMVAHDDKLTVDRLYTLRREGPQDYSLPYRMLAESEWEKSDTTHALALADSALAIDSFSVEAWGIRAHALAGSDSSGARQAQQQILKLDPWMVRPGGVP